MHFFSVREVRAEYQGRTPGMPEQRGGLCGNSFLRTAVEGCECPGAGAARGIEGRRGARRRVRTRVCRGMGRHERSRRGSSSDELSVCPLLLHHRILVLLHLAFAEA